MGRRAMLNSPKKRQGMNITNSYYGYFKNTNSHRPVLFTGKTIGFLNFSYDKTRTDFQGYDILPIKSNLLR